MILKACGFQCSLLITATHRFAENKKFRIGKNSPWFRAIFASAKMVHGEAKEVSAYTGTVKADKSCKDFSLLLPRFSFEQRKA
jgi:hypothetical protein